MMHRGNIASVTSNCKLKRVSTATSTVHLGG
jgi:hypothetical protein